ncbi:ferredoxin [Streptomyces sp. NPDC002867]
MGERWQVDVDREVCIGSAMCVAALPEGFRLDSARQSHPVEHETPASEELMGAAENCPVEAISLRLAGTGEAVFPPED